MSFTAGVGRSAKAFSRFWGWDRSLAQIFEFRSSPFCALGVGSKDEEALATVRSADVGSS